MTLAGGGGVEGRVCPCAPSQDSIVRQDFAGLGKKQKLSSLSNPCGSWLPQNCLAFPDSWHICPSTLVRCETGFGTGHGGRDVMAYLILWMSLSFHFHTSGIKKGIISILLFVNYHSIDEGW
jgi:hypothetical protein